jgi:hypothetical protein
MRFSIRDLLWLTLVAAMGLGWLMCYQAVDDRRLEAVNQAHRLRTALDRTTRTFGSTNVKLLVPVDWSVLDEPLVEP